MSDSDNIGKNSKNKTQKESIYGLTVKTGKNSLVITPEIEKGDVPLYWGGHIANDYEWHKE